MGKPKSKKPKSKKKVKLPEIQEPVELAQAPHSFVIHRGLSCPYIQDLTLDFRRLMEPFTASNLKEKKANRIKDFVSLSGVFSVSHMGIFNKRATQLSFKIVRMPRGPTLTFKVHEFTLSRDVLTLKKQQYVNEEMFQHSPLVILNNFTGEGKHIKLMANSFQNMFPSINLAQINVSTMKRCVLYSYNPVTKLVEMRHYSIQIVPVGLHKGVKKIVQGNIPNLSKCTDISDFFLQGGGGASDSEMEDEDEATTVRDVNPKINCENNKSSIKLHEIGPRLTLELVKIEDGLLTGEVLYHSTVSKTSEEIEAIRAQVEKKRKQKEYNKKVQKANQEKNKSKDNPRKKGYVPNDREDMEDDRDDEYYRQEVGEEPDEEIFRTKDTKYRKRKHSK
ncbi:protein Peter pan [Episyrphus balteatus]|uniref:protein Peter pan n=1 Tax=Episyrphus balteatus TaxID=286459 RepID=UPI002485E9EF|nr:protein Peter pan [Episyrphus balteatus]